jgi:hypothetical protein
MRSAATVDDLPNTDKAFIRRSSFISAYYADWRLPDRTGKTGSSGKFDAWKRSRLRSSCHNSNLGSNAEAKTLKQAAAKKGKPAIQHKVNRWLTTRMERGPPSPTKPRSAYALKSWRVKFAFIKSDCRRADFNGRKR